MSNNFLNVSELDYNQVKQNLKDYFKREGSPFKDWDFDGAGLDLILSILANNTHMNAVMASMVFNESFLDSAQLRKNVVSRSKLLGYVPTSVTSSRASLNLTFSPDANVPVEDRTFIILEKGTIFTSDSSFGSYNFITLSDYKFLYDSVEDVFVYDGDVQITEGTLTTEQYKVDNSLERQKFVVADENIDVSTLKVRVYDTVNSSNPTTYVQFSELYTTDGNSPVYFINENPQGLYEITFGDGALGVKLGNLNIVEFEYVTSAGDDSNGITEFVYSGSIPAGADGAPDIAVVEGSSGGAERETIQSVRFNAPNSLITQNRAVTAKDYRNLIAEEFTNLEALNVWGGEDEVEFDPDEFYKYAGQVYISAKPIDSLALSDEDEARILALLDGKRVFTIATNFVDPEFTELALDVTYQYDPNKTNDSTQTLNNNVADVIQTYNDEVLRDFDGIFRESNLLTEIDSSDAAIISSAMDVVLHKNLTVDTQTDVLTEILEFTLGGSSDAGANQSYAPVTAGPQAVWIGQVNSDYTVEWNTDHWEIKNLADVLHVGATEAVDFPWLTSGWSDGTATGTPTFSYIYNKIFFYGVPVEGDISVAESIISTETFVRDGLTVVLQDIAGDPEVDLVREVKLFEVTGAGLVDLNIQVGSLDPYRGKIVFSEELYADSTSVIEISATPGVADLPPDRNNLIRIDSSRVSVSGDTI